MHTHALIITKKRHYIYTSILLLKQLTWINLDVHSIIQDKSVSYTHLDVYKRQALNSEWGCANSATV